LSPDGLDEGVHNEAQGPCEPSREQAKVVAGGRRIVLPFSRDKFRASSVVDRPEELGSSFDRLADLTENGGDLVTVRQATADADTG
jgi:hypothetical protein